MRRCRPTARRTTMPEDRSGEVSTPGGMRPGSMVHRVGPGQAVSGHDSTVTATEEPEGMRPPSATDTMSSAQARKGAGKRSAGRKQVSDEDIESLMQPPAPETPVQSPADEASATEYREEPPGMRPLSTEQSGNRTAGGNGARGMGARHRLPSERRPSRRRSSQRPAAAETGSSFTTSSPTTFSNGAAT